MSIEQKIFESTNVDDSTSAAIVGNTVLPAVADFGNGIVLYNEDCLQALRKLNDKQFNLANVLGNYAKLLLPALQYWF